MKSPSNFQQLLAAYAPKPCAGLSLLSSCFVIYHLVFERPEKRKRMYHRLILSMNVNLLPLTLSFIWGTFAMPKDTPDFIGARGTIQTCTAQGFLVVTFILSVPFYYASLGICSYLAVKNNFKEAKYQWIEKWIHLGAYFFPLSVTLFAVLNEAVNPRISTCFVGAAPLGCELDPDVECMRGDERVFLVSVVVALGQGMLYFVVPLVAMLLVRRFINKVQENVQRTRGMKQVIESARKRMLNDTAAQIRLYLFSYWLTYVFSVAAAICRAITGKIMYELFILGDCFLALQGTIIMLVYFKLQRRSRSTAQIFILPGSTSTPQGENHPKGELPSRTLSRTLHKHQTVSDIRLTAESKQATETSTSNADNTENETPLSFSIFDGVPSEDSPWAQFINDTGEDSFHDEGVSIDYDINETEPNYTSSTALANPPFDQPTCNEDQGRNSESPPFTRDTLGV